MVLHQNLSYWTSIVQFTIGGDDYKTMGERTPALFMFKNVLQIRFATDSKANYDYSCSIELNKKTNVKVLQLKTQLNEAFKMILINNEAVLQFSHPPLTNVFSNIKCFLGNPWMKPAPVTISNFRYTSNFFYEGNLLSYF